MLARVGQTPILLTNCQYNEKYSLVGIICLFVSPVFILYPSSVVGTLKNEIPGAALELCQLKLKQFSPEILKFSRKHEVILLLSTLLWFLALVCLYLMQARVDWVLIIFGTQVIEKKRPVRPVFPDYLSVSYDYD